jgi:hypothetical protein
VPSSRWGNEITIMEEMHWSWSEYLDAPAELVDEIGARRAGRAKAEKEQQRKSELAAKRR